MRSTRQTHSNQQHKETIGMPEIIAMQSTEKSIASGTRVHVRVQGEDSLPLSCFDAHRLLQGFECIILRFQRRHPVGIQRALTSESTSARALDGREHSMLCAHRTWTHASTCLRDLIAVETEDDTPCCCTAYCDVKKDLAEAFASSSVCYRWLASSLSPIWCHVCFPCLCLYRNEEQDTETLWVIVKSPGLSCASSA
jgi:hypothetical protein